MKQTPPETRLEYSYCLFLFGWRIKALFNVLHKSTEVTKRQKKKIL